MNEQLPECPKCGSTTGIAECEPCKAMAGLPTDLARVLRDQSVTVSQDQDVFELVAKWQDAPSNTASA